MAFAAVVNVVGVLSGVVGILQFGIDNFAPKDDEGSTVVQLAIGLDVPDGLNNAGGDLPDVRLFNEAGAFLGMAADPGDVADGTLGKVTVSTNGQQSAYTLFSANSNAICIAYATITWPSGDQYAWPGDWGRQCGASWYYSNYFVKGTDARPDCMWIDSDGDQPQTGFQLHWPEFVEKSGDAANARDVDYYCNSGVAFGIRTEQDPNTITYWVLNNAKRSITDWFFGKRSATAIAEGPHKKKVVDWTPRGRSTHVRRANETSGHVGSAKFHDRLVKDNNARHPATELCESESSVGPDFLDIAHGQFCRMSDKTLWPVCGGNVADDCFNLDLHQLVVGGIATRDSPYSNVADWSAGN
ncbi:hypothetical protein HJFPF1_12558 [Paramyrothecium foliicola]|nr:hypothetical protein HJFPF1_12558 [Paramyrothecium foliicola]